MKTAKKIRPEDIFQWHLPKGYGKFEDRKSWFQRGNPCTSTAQECYSISRKNIQTGKIEMVEWLLEPSRITRCRGRIHFSVDGYGDDDRELYEIPEVRRFFTNLLKRVHLAIFLCSISDPRPLRFLAACVSDPIQICRSSDKSSVGVRVKEATLKKFCAAGLTCHNLLCGAIQLAPSETLLQFAQGVEFLTGRVGEGHRDEKG